MEWYVANSDGREIAWQSCASHSHKLRASATAMGIQTLHSSKQKAFKSKPLLARCQHQNHRSSQALLSHSAVPVYTLQSIQPVFVQKLAEYTLSNVTQAVHPGTTQHACTAS